MKFTTTAGALRDAMSRSRQLVSASPVLAAYAGVMLTIENAEIGRLRSIASDGESTMISDVSVTDAEAGSVLLSPRPVLGLLSSLSSSCVVHMSLTPTGDAQFSGEGFNPYVFRPVAATFPMPVVSAAGQRPAGLVSLGDGLAAVRCAAGRGSAAVQVVSDGDQLVLHTTDGYRLARVVLPGAGFGTFSGVLALTALERAARSNVTEVTVDLRGRTVVFGGDSTTLITRLLATPFPAVDSVLSNSPPPATYLSASDLNSAMTRIVTVVDQGTITLDFVGSELRIEASTAEIGAGTEVVTLETPVASSFRMQLRAPYLQEAVSAMGNARMALAYSGPLQPLYLSAIEPVRTTHVVMPVRA